MPKTKSGPAQRAIPTTINENPSNNTVNLPAQAIAQKIRRKGRVAINQTPPSILIAICPNE
jgi:hypothetical protein